MHSLPAVNKTDLQRRNRRTLVMCSGLFGVLLLLFSPLVLNHDGAPWFALMGVSGAIFANSTGAGGGVVFIPIFNSLSFTEAQAVATSFGIQCFGMTAGTIAWLRFRKHLQALLPQWRPFVATVAVTAASAVPALWIAQIGWFSAPATLKTLFSLFSIFLGSALLLLVIFRRQPGHSVVLLPLDFLALILIGFVGGLVTAWLSVGVGEMMALYLLIRRFDASMSVAAAVCVSAVSVWSAIPHHIALGEVQTSVVLVAGPSAVLGGILARVLVSYLSPRRLKLFFSSWVLITGILTAPCLGIL